MAICTSFSCLRYRKSKLFYPFIDIFIKSPLVFNKFNYVCGHNSVKNAYKTDLFRPSYLMVSLQAQGTKNHKTTNRITRVYMF